MTKRTSIRLALAAAAVAGGLAAASAPALATTGATANSGRVAPGATGTFLAICPSYAPHMLADTIKITAPAGVAISTDLTRDSDVFHRDLLKVTAVNGTSASAYVAITASCTS
ncbi:hypothetical protein [Microbispora triticiradicis]|uniref:hypothetical protein n=1 Tax=Microbispora triticiradicis TaxID=2200763 RepID=UPI001AD6EF74|nr:hypothetical protein [Microbispora triticiradicis]MBO4273074.1 hypothetical protein [Microbispora triticiradicis]